MKALDQNVNEQQITESTTNICFLSMSCLLCAAQITFETHRYKTIPQIYVKKQKENLRVTP
jgi:hypothetical protein